MATAKWEKFFKPETRKSGLDLLKKEAVTLQRGSDTQLGAYARGTTPVRISFKADSITSKIFYVDCTCSSGKKGQLCKHIWAALELVAEKNPDFLECKETLEKVTHQAQSTEKPKKEATQREIDFKQKQAEYRKQAYQVQKERAKNFKQKKSSKHQAPELPDDVQAAINYFEENGFSVAPPFSEADINSAKRELSKIFHPDKGGSQEEILLLLRHADLLLKYT